MVYVPLPEMLRMKSSHSNRLCCLFQCARVWLTRHLGMKSSQHHVGRICASIMHARVVARATDSTISDGMFHQPHDHIDRSPSLHGRYRSIGRHRKMRGPLTSARCVDLALLVQPRPRLPRAYIAVLQFKQSCESSSVFHHVRCSRPMR